MSPAWPSESVPESVSLGDRDDQQTQVALVDRHTAQRAFDLIGAAIPLTLNIT